MFNQMATLILYCWTKRGKIYLSDYIHYNYSLMVWYYITNSESKT